MRGRSITYNVMPFSFNEFLRARGIEYKKHLSSSEKAFILNSLREYIEYGGYPEATVYAKERERILTDIFETAIYKDVIERSRIRNIKAMKLLINGLSNSVEF